MWSNGVGAVCILLTKKLSRNNFYSSKSLTYFEELKHGLPRYQNKHQQITNQTKSDCTIQQESNGFWDYWRLRVQSCSSPINPDLHVHTYDPHVIEHVLSLRHLTMNVSHLSASVVKLERNRGKKYMNNQLKTKAFWFLSKNHRNSAIRKNLNLFEGFPL